MGKDDYLICPCFECQYEIGFLAEFLGRKIKCPHCHQETTLYDPNDEGEPVSDLETETSQDDLEVSPPTENSPSLSRCRTCDELIAKSAEVCVHCGQRWPTMNFICTDCGGRDFDIEVHEDNSSVWATPSLLGVLSAAIWEAMRSKPKSYLRCLSCGCLFHLPYG
jgi:hypothetical protein